MELGPAKRSERPPSAAGGSGSGSAAAAPGISPSPSVARLAAAVEARPLSPAPPAATIARRVGDASGGGGTPVKPAARDGLGLRKTALGPANK